MRFVLMPLLPFKVKTLLKKKAFKHKWLLNVEFRQ